MTNDTPPTACLADFGFTTLVPDQEVLVSSGVALQGGTMTFMAPELLAPSNYGLKGSFPTREADVYAFGLVIFQVIYRHILHFCLDIQSGPDGRAAVSWL